MFPSHPRLCSFIFAALLRVVSVCFAFCLVGPRVLRADVPVIPNQTINGSVGTILYYQTWPDNIDTTTTYACTAGTLPPGVFLDASTGYLDGRATTAGNYSLTVTATQTFVINNKTITNTASGTIAISISPAPSPTVSSLAGLISTMAGTLAAGTVVVVADGTYTFAATDIVKAYKASAGTNAAPITLRAQTPGGVVFSGTVQMVLGKLDAPANHLILDGFRFQSGGPNANRVIKLFGRGSRVTECSFKSFNTGADPDETNNWMSLVGGNRNRVDHCYFGGKRGQGAILTVEMQDSETNFDGLRHRIDQNVFIDFQKGASTSNNGFEAIRLGDSTISDRYGVCLVEYNYFSAIDGDAEFISNKTHANTYRYNTIINSQGSLCLRIGSGCSVLSNFIRQGGAVDGQGGIRVSGYNHTVKWNYVQGVRASGSGSGVRRSSFLGGVVVMGWASGGSTLFRGASYNQTGQVFVEDNTLVDCENTFVYGTTNRSTSTANVIDLKPGENISDNQVTGSQPKVYFTNNVARTNYPSGSLPAFPIVIGTPDTGSSAPYPAVLGIDAVEYSGEVYFAGMGNPVGLSPLPAGVSDADPAMVAYTWTSPNTFSTYTYYLSAAGGTAGSRLFPLFREDVGPASYIP